MIVVGCVLFIMLVTFVSWYFGFYSDYKIRCVSKISFQKFLEIFETSYRKISLSKGYFHYSPNMFGSSYSFYFSIPDTFRYEYWRKAREHKLEEDYKNNKMTEIEKAWQKDAEQYMEDKAKHGNTN